MSSLSLHVSLYVKIYVKIYVKKFTDLPRNGVLDPVSSQPSKDSSVGYFYMVTVSHRKIPVHVRCINESSRLP